MRATASRASGAIKNRHMKAETRIVLLRGVMPTGKNKVSMTPLRAALEAAGFRDVRTYIQSGNVLLSTGLNQASIEKRVHDVIAEEFGGDIVVFARTLSWFKDVLAANPFAGADPAKLYFTLLSAVPEKHRLEEFQAATYSPDQVRVVGDMVYVLCATQYSDLKINNNAIERKLKVSATTRVYNTIANLVNLGEP